mgnify:CR=1 FL=1
MIITGKVSQIIYRNENNGYTVFLLKSEGEYITAVGETGSIEPGDEFELEGEIFQVLEFSHVKPGKGSAFMKMKLKNIVLLG